MKPRKPARIKGSVIPVFPPDGGPHKLALLLPLDNPDALVEQVAQAIYNIDRKERGMDHPIMVFNSGAYEGHQQRARAALRSIGVPLKGRK